MGGTSGRFRRSPKSGDETRRLGCRGNRGRGSRRILLLLAVVAARDAPISPPALPAKAAAPAPPRPQHPIGPEAEAAPLPALKDSDATMLAAIGGLLGLDSVGQVVKPESLVYNIVATIDNLPRAEITQRVNPLQPVPGVP